MIRWLLFFSIDGTILLYRVWGEWGYRLSELELLICGFIFYPCAIGRLQVQQLVPQMIIHAKSIVPHFFIYYFQYIYMTQNLQIIWMKITINFHTKLQQISVGEVIRLICDFKFLFIQLQFLINKIFVTKFMRSLMILFGVLMLVLPMGETLHLSKHLGFESYVDLLRSAQQDLKTLASNLRQAINSALEEVDAKEDLDEKIAFMENALTDQNEKIKEIQLKMSVSFQQSEVTCPNYYESDGEALKKQVSDLNQLLSTLPQTLDNLSDNEGIEPIEAEKDRLLQETQGIHDHMDGLVTFVPEDSEITYVTNVAADNWMLGEATPQSLQSQFSVQDKVIVACPFDTPFSNHQNRCITCNEGEYFDMSKKDCSACKNYNNETRICEDTWGSNLNIAPSRLILPSTVSLSDLSADNMCPEDLPFHNGKECINCSDQQIGIYFDYAEKKCSKCQQNMQYQSQKFSCVKKTVYSTNLDDQISYGRIIFEDGENSLESERQKINGLKNDFNVIICPLETPFYGSKDPENTQQKQCISCGEGDVFDFKGFICTRCDENQYFNNKTHLCEEITKYSNIDAGYWISSQLQKDVRNKIEEAKNTPGSIICPVEQPFFDGENCIKCEDNQIFNFDSSKCQSCDDEKEFFSFNLKKCVEKQVNNAQTNPSTAPNLLYEGFHNNRWMYVYYKNLVLDPNIMDCPTENPFWDQYACVNCPEDRPYFNLQYKLCQQCYEGSTYNEQKRQCVGEDGNTVLQGPVIESLTEFEKYLSNREKTILQETIQA